MKNLLITGGTGFIGRHLTEILVKDGWHVYILTRSADKKRGSDSITFVNWLNADAAPEKQLPDIHAVVNLAGESINGRWTKGKKKAILESRMTVTKELISLAEKMRLKPEVWVNASAVGFYGTSQTDSFTERSPGRDEDFLAHVTALWEGEATKAAQLGIRLVITRFGVVLGRDGGALKQMTAPYYYYAGGRVGSGNQWLSWIHVEDVARLLKFVIENNDIEGPVNATSPHPVTMDEFGKETARVLNKPHWLPAPAIALKLLLGEMSMLVLKGQHVIPEQAIDHGFSFTYQRLPEALRDLLQ
ncbi:TIGR01777 family oxidoreductase [Fictibacillus aquaticus]|uniref:TIGR01777 family protein n=1 Tax=Fictibacillus aquaticus TaxID=2021314 RepID=A0A235F577_9BACL|nr:TIGR01777 family oxidoreductase [Fictibacillus aquaticus]OYD56456.1 TIGR01777 family protein [Fictibacillus aquaticus]